MTKPNRRTPCAGCQYFEPTGEQKFFEHSDKTYKVGNCNHPDPQLGGAMPHWKDLGRTVPEWTSCYQVKPKRNRKANALRG